MKSGSHFNFAILVIILLAVLVRGSIPLGFMPDINKTASITICSGLTTKTIFVHDTSPSPAHNQSEEDKPCPFALPVLAGNENYFNTVDYIRVAYAKFYPDLNAPEIIGRIAIKSFLSQGPPARFSA